MVSSRTRRLSALSGWSSENWSRMDAFCAWITPSMVVCIVVSSLFSPDGSSMRNNWLFSPTNCWNTADSACSADCTWVFMTLARSPSSRTSRSTRSANMPWRGSK